MKEYEHRQEAICRYLAGEKVSKIAKSFGNSRKWLHAWIKRYNAKTDDNWYKDFSKAPIKTSRSLDTNTEQQILLIR